MCTDTARKGSEEIIACVQRKRRQFASLVFALKEKGKEIGKVKLGDRKPGQQPPISGIQCSEVGTQGGEKQSMTIHHQIP